MKVVSYNPKNIENVSKFFNESILEYKNEETFDGYIMFIFDDILNHANNQDELKNSYKNLLDNFNLPYAFYPYYLHFNKVLSKTNSIPNPKIYGKHDSKEFDVVNQPCFGLLILNLNKLNDFKFNEDYKVSFYIQDLIFYCKENKLYVSDAFFVDVHNSYKLFNDNFKNGFLPNVDQFKKEKELFFSKHEAVNENINNFINLLKEHLNPSTEILTQLSEHLKENNA